MIFSLLKFKKNFYNLSLFRILYVISLLFETVCFTETIFGWINGFLIFWAFLIFLHIMFNEPYKLKIENRTEIIVFILLSILTSFVNFSSNFLMNLITSFHNFMCIFFFLGMYKNTSKEKIKKEMKFMLNFFLYFSILFSLGGFYSIFLSKTNDYPYRIGIYENRFFGISTNPNQAGLVSVISIFSCDLLNDLNCKNKVNRFISILCVFINIITLFLTDSNASFVFLISYLGVKMLYETFSKYEKIKDIKFIRETFFVFISLVVMISSSFLLRASCQIFVSKFLSKAECKTLTTVNNIEEEEIVETKLGRGNHEISSGRIQLLKQGLKLSKIHPLIGIGRENLPYYGKIYLNGGLAFPSKHQDLHNIYMSLIVSYGWIGFILFIIFILKNIRKIISEIFTQTHSKKSKILSKFLSIIISYFAYGTFEIGIMSGMFLPDILIWVFFGYALSLSDQD